MKLKERKVISHEGWKTTRSERINYYIGDLGRTLEGYIVTAFMTLFCCSKVSACSRSQQPSWWSRSSMPATT